MKPPPNLGPWIEAWLSPPRFNAEARRRLGTEAPPEKIIPELSFGVWRHFTSSAHEATLWVPVLHRAYPAGTSRAEVDRAITGLHKLRNRAAHWEPLLRWPVAQSQIDLLTVCGMLNPELAAYLHDSSDIPHLLEQRPC